MRSRPPSARRSPSRLTPLVPLVVALLSGACSSGSATPAGVDGAADAVSDVAPESSPPLDAEPPACRLVAKYSSKNVPCNDCAEARCCAEVNGCLGDPRCNDDYVNCILACALLPDDAGADAAGATQDCVAKCGVDFPEGRAAYEAAIGCVDGKCASECQP